MSRSHSGIIKLSSMYLTTGFVAGLLSKETSRVYGLLDGPSYIPPRLQVTSLHSNPNMMRFRNILRGSGINVPVISLQDVQWMTVSDGNYSISATLNSDLKHLVETGWLRENTVFELNGYSIEKNIDEAYAGRELVLFVGHITCVFPNFPEQIGDPKDIFDAARDGPIARHDPRLSAHPLLALTSRAIQGIFEGKPKARQIFRSMTPLNVQVTKIGKLNANLWFVTLFDGYRRCMGFLWTELEPEKYGVKGHLRNNVSEIMTDGSNALKEGDVISFTEVAFFGEEPALFPCLYHIDIEHRA